jgi:hypothetical protein
VPGPLRRRGIGILALAALAACAGERGEDSAGVAARGEDPSAIAGVGAEAMARPGRAPAGGDPGVALPGARPGGGSGVATAVAPPETPVEDTASAGRNSRRTVPPPAVQPPDPLAMDSLLPPQPDAAEAQRLAAQGERIFHAKGCNRCHTVGEGDRDGPDLAGVAERRNYAWIVMMLTLPEYMVQADHTAQQLLIEHFLEMPNLELTAEEARALWAYLAAVRTPRPPQASKP